MVQFRGGDLPGFNTDFFQEPDTSLTERTGQKTNSPGPGPFCQRCIEFDRAFQFPENIKKCCIATGEGHQPGLRRQYLLCKDNLHLGNIRPGVGGGVNEIQPPLQVTSVGRTQFSNNNRI
jgi:hypothetical protein